MENRLCILVRNKLKNIAALYYEDMAYTIDSFEILADLKKHVFDNLRKDEILNEKTLQLAIIRFAEHYTGHGCITDVTGLRHGGVEAEDRAYIRSMFPEEKFLDGNDGVDSNYGLVALSHEEIYQIRADAEGQIWIDIADGEPTVYFDVYNERFPLSNLLYHIEKEQIYVMHLDIGKFMLKDLDDVLKAVDEMNTYYENMDYGDTYVFWMGGVICSFIDGCNRYIFL